MHKYHGINVYFDIVCKVEVIYIQVIWEVSGDYSFISDLFWALIVILKMKLHA
jgi:hypothetical protein